MGSTAYFIKLFTVILSSIAISSCMMGPDFKSPPVPTTQRFTETSLPNKTASSTIKLHGGHSQHFVIGKDIPTEWWTLFHSTELNRLIETGLDNSPNLTAAQAALTQAKEVVNAEIGSALYPAVSAQLSGERQKLSGASFDSSTPAKTFNLYNASVNVSYTLDFFGAARREIESLRAQVDYQRYLLDAAYLTLTANIVTTSITAASLRDQVIATQKLIVLQQDQLNIVKQQFQFGGASRNDVLTQQSQVAQTKASLPPLQQSLTQANHALSVLIGELPSESKIPAFKLDQLQLPRELPVSLPSSLVRQRPDIQASEALLHAASAQIGVATANLYPQITLNGSYGWQSTSPNTLFHPAYNIWSATGALLQPVFNGGALMAKKRQAIAAYQQAEAQYEQTVLQAFQNVADTLRALTHDAEALRANQQAENAARDSLFLTQKQYKLGAVNYLTLLTAQRQFQQARIARIQSQATRYTDTAALFQALGGGWWNATID